MVDLVTLSLLGIFGGVANLWLSQSYKFSEVSLVTPLKYLALVFAIIFGYLIWDEVPTLKTLSGALLVILSSVIIFRREIQLKNKFQFQGMTKAPSYWKKAKNYLSKKDKVMKSLINKYDDTTLSTRKDIFYSLCKSIVGQQISVAAANSVFKKFSLACKGRVSPNNVKKLNITKLKKCGPVSKKQKV